MTAQQTPLLGDENTPMRTSANGGTGFEGATPRHHISVTPNPLATPRGEEAIHGTPLKTPIRDRLRINQEDTNSEGGDGATPRQRQFAANLLKRTLRQGFGALPKPENNFELLVPEDEVGQAEENSEVVEDAAERDLREKRRQEEASRLELWRRSIVVQLSLPRQAVVDVNDLREKLDIGVGNGMEKNINEELVRLMEYDSVVHPLPGTSRRGHSKVDYKHPEDEYLKWAREEVQRELARMVGFPEASEEQTKQGLIAIANDEEVDEGWSWPAVRERMTFDPDSRSWKESSEMGCEKGKKGMSLVLDEIRERMAQEAGKVGKTEKRLGKVLGGYQTRSGVLGKRVTEAFSELEKAEMEMGSFSKLEGNESAAGPRRLRLLEEENERLERREGMLQMRYGELERERDGVSGRVSVLEEKLMTEAENVPDND